MTAINSAVDSIREALLKLRTETGCDEWATRVRLGKIQLARVSYGDNGKSFVWPISDWLTLDAMPAFINQIPR